MATADIHIEEGLQAPEEHGHEHEHHQNFWTKYIFSEDHKTIAKQFLITGILLALLGGIMSVVFKN